jgi:hypothetical protein
MSRGKSSGITLTNKDASIALGMVARGDREHDIAAWFGVNQGRIAEVKGGSHGSIANAPSESLPPKGPPGVKGRRLRFSVQKAIEILSSKGEVGTLKAVEILKEAQQKYDLNES